MLQVGDGPSTERRAEVAAGVGNPGQPLVRCGDAVEVLERARRQLGVRPCGAMRNRRDWTYARSTWRPGPRTGNPWREIPSSA